MFPTGEELRRGIAAVIPLLTFKDSGLVLLSDDRAAAWRSFSVATLALPVYLIIVLDRQRELPLEPLGLHFFSVWLLAYALRWTLLPLALIEFARSKPMGARLPRFITAYNWLVLVLVHIDFIIVMLPPVLSNMLRVFFLFYVIAVKIYLAKRCLDIGTLGAIILPLAAFFVNRIIESVAFNLTFLEPALPT
ncbi:MAG: hypothetical protein GDA41_03310 [Rhodospirillales bacterium]|nr:hypothetical protein [Rhodospirillales bacterium]